MKIRNGFVSNSSSSSFVIYGYRLYEDDFIRALNIENVQIKNKELIEEIKNFDGTETCYIITDLENEKLDIGLYREYDTGYICIGLEPNNQDENQSLKDFKEHALSKIEKYIDVNKCKYDIKVGWHGNCG